MAEPETVVAVDQETTGQGPAAVGGPKAQVTRSHTRRQANRHADASTKPLSRLICLVKGESCVSTSSSAPRVGLFVTCLVDNLRPNVGFAALRLLEAAGCTVEVPKAQTCCGQPALNSGDNDTTRELAKRTIQSFEDYDFCVAPSGSCLGTIKHHYAELFHDDPAWARRHAAFAAKCHELLSFLHDVRGFRPTARYQGRVTYHHSCSGLRELGVRGQAEALVRSVDGVTLQPLATPDICCGFGGTFCVKYPEISTSIADDKLADVAQTGADTLLGGDLGCLVHLAGRLHRQGSKVKVYHTAEVLAGMAEVPLGGGR
ncbi:MAG: (Fe-S)-binding protein [Geminicoccaceae bacterium]|nr:MAG: (Fe-S)-binding protein [Geminicoccaceae bacterium]